MKRFFWIISTSAFCLALLSCGGGPGAPGSSGSADTGIEIQSVSIVPNATSGGDKGPDLDVNVRTCPNGKPETGETGLYRVDATMTITASKLNPNSDFDPFPATVTQCTITYKQPADEYGAPVIEAWTIYPDCTLTEGSNTCVANLIDIARKMDYWNNVINIINDPQKYPTRYTASYDCTYMNNFGKSGHLGVDLDIFLADFGSCSS